MEDEKMIRLYDGPVTLLDGAPVPVSVMPGDDDILKGRTVSHKIINSHNHGVGRGKLKLKFDWLISHDITYVGIIQTARASGMGSFPVPYVLTNCHNSLCAVGGTINEDDHVFGLSAAKKYGGIFVPANQAVIHQYAREALAASGGMILGSDSHTRFGPLGTMGIGEGGPELVKQLLNNTYDIDMPEVVLVWLENTTPHGVGPHDVAIALCGAVYESGFVRNKILEFAGPGLAGLPIDFRFGIDVMTTETACLSSIWSTDDREVSDFYERHGREDAYKPLRPDNGAVYDAMIKLDLSMAAPMIAMPFHPSRAYTIADMNANAADILRETEREIAGQFGGKLDFKLTDKVKDGRLMTDQGVIAGCAGGTYDNIRESACILEKSSIGDGYFSLSIYPSSMPVNLQLVDSGIQGKLIRAGAVFKPCFCGPCFGAGDVPANNAFSIRHTTRNFINREGSKPGDGQLAAVALMDARSIAATAKNKGLLTSAAEIEYDIFTPGAAPPEFDKGIYEKRVYNGVGIPLLDSDLIFGPNIADWPQIGPLGDNLLIRLTSVIHDPVTTTDELIPSGEASSYRSNPIKLASFTLSRKDPQYVARAAEVRGFEEARRGGGAPAEALAEAEAVLKKALGALGSARGKKTALDAMGTPDGKKAAWDSVQISSAIFARKPGDGSAREQAASCQRVLGGGANLCYEYATKRYRSNLINWGMLPFRVEEGYEFTAAPGDWLYVPDARKKLGGPVMSVDAGTGEVPDGAGAESEAGAGAEGRIEFDALLLRRAGDSGDPASYSAEGIKLYIDALTGEERGIILSGCLMNYYAAKNKP